MYCTVCTIEQKGNCTNNCKVKCERWRTDSGRTDPGEQVDRTNKPDTSGRTNPIPPQRETESNLVLALVSVGNARTKVC